MRQVTILDVLGPFGKAKGRIKKQLRLVRTQLEIPSPNNTMGSISRCCSLPIPHLPKKTKLLLPGFYCNHRLQVTGNLYMNLQLPLLGTNMCAMVESRHIWDGHPTFNRNPYLMGI